MKRIAVIDSNYIRDAQVYIGDPDKTEDDYYCGDDFADVKYPCQYLGIYKGTDENEIRKQAADSFGVNPGVISLMPLDTSEDMTEDESSEETITFEFSRLKEHVGHQTEIVTYGGNRNVAIECIDCCEVLYSVDNPQHSGSQEDE